MSFVVDVFVGNYPVIDWELYSLWVEGLTVTEAIHVLKERGIFTQAGLQFDLLVSDLNDNYRLFTMWETMLHHPIMFSDQLVFQLDSETQNFLIEKYYALDSSVVRELLGKKLSGRLRKDLDEVSDRTKVSLRSCRRQFDNIKRVFKSVEELPGNFLQNIKNMYLLPERLADKYSVVVFIACHRFETTKKKLGFLSFDDFSVVCKAIMKDWTSGGVDVDESGEPSLDRDFFNYLRDLKNLADKEKDHRYAVCQYLGRNNMSQRPLSEIEANFKHISKNILNIGQTLYNTKEVKDLFVNVVDKIVEPTKQCKLSIEDLSMFLSAYCKVVVEGTLQVESDLRTNFEKYMKTITVIVLTFFKAWSSKHL